MIQAEDIRELKLSDESQAELQALMKAGVHIGHVKSKTHPAMRTLIFTTRNNIEIIDVVKTSEYLAKAEAFLRGVAARGGLVLLVGTKPTATWKNIPSRNGRGSIFCTSRLPRFMTACGF